MGLKNPPSSLNSGQSKKCQIFYIKAQFESPKHQQIFWNLKVCTTYHASKCFCRWKCQQNAESKSSPKECHLFWLLHLHKKITISFKKKPNWWKITQSGQPLTCSISISYLNFSYKPYLLWCKDHSFMGVSSVLGNLCWIQGLAWITVKIILSKSYP